MTLHKMIKAVLVSFYFKINLKGLEDEVVDVNYLPRL